MWIIGVYVLGMAVDGGMDPTAQVLRTVLPMDLTATAVGALGGALVARRKQFDLMGMFFLATVSGLGGGILRDVLVGRIPPAALTNGYFMLTVFGAVILTAFLERPVHGARHILFVVDAASLGLFACVGVQLALAMHLEWPAAIFIGMLNALGGGILRDMLMSETAEILLPGPILATVIFIGCCLYLLLILVVDLNIYLAWIITASLTFTLRIVGVWRRWSLPEPVDLTTLPVFNVERRKRFFFHRLWFNRLFDKKDKQ